MITFVDDTKQINYSDKTIVICTMDRKIFAIKIIKFSKFDFLFELQFYMRIQYLNQNKKNKL